ncbi:MAG: hypothetical protein MJ025_03700 [Victivallaceae bacterium]|nr:hypothetical protein [Victivallaceae bacterium]
MDNKTKLKIVIFAVACLILCGCSSTPENNYLNPADFATYLGRAGVKVDGVRELPPDPFRANSGVGIMISGSEIGVYKYDTSIRVQAERIARLRETKRTYVCGIPYPIEVYGSFMVLGLDKNPSKHKIIKALHSFE